MSGHGMTIERFAEIGSTNTYLLAKARTGAPGRLVAVTDHQTEGRGRLDRRWEAPPGSSLLVSILLRERIEPDEAHLLTASVALAAAAGVEDLTGVRPQLKWPNDLVVDGAKLAGILAELDAGAPGGEPGTTAVVVGMGMNLTWPGPPGVGGTSVQAATGVAVDRDELLERLLEGLAKRLVLLADEAGRRALAAELESSLATLGQEVVVTTSTSTIRGVATGLSAAGHLLVGTEEGSVEIVTGDVTQVRSVSEAPPSAE